MKLSFRRNEVIGGVGDTLSMDLDLLASLWVAPLPRTSLVQTETAGSSQLNLLARVLKTR